MSTSNTPQLCLVLQSKPRASKTSKRYSIGNIDFFFKISQAETGGGIKIYYDSKPYPYLKFIAQRYHYETGWYSEEEITDIAIKWCSDNMQEIIKKLKALDTYIKIDESVWRENENKRST